MDLSAAFKESMGALSQARSQYEAKHDTAVLEHLAYAKKHFIYFPTYFQPSASSRSRKEEILLVREVLEYECLSAARVGDVDTFNSGFAGLKTYYADFASSDIPPSTRQLLLVGLHLIALLVQNRIAEFHAQLELLSTENLSSMYLRPVVELERYLMEGSYTKLLEARKSVPTNDYETFLNMLTDTVSSEIARCMALSYESVSQEAAVKLLMLPSKESLADIVEANQWHTDKGGRIKFHRGDDPTEAHRFTVNFNTLLQEQLGIAFELQRIV